MTTPSGHIAMRVTAPDAQTAALHRQFDVAIRQRDAAAAETAELREVNAGLCCRVAELEGALAVVRAERDTYRAQAAW